MKRTFFLLVALLASFATFANNPKTKLVIISQTAGSTASPNNIVTDEVSLSGEYDESTLYINVENFYGNVSISIHRNSTSPSLITYTEGVYEDTTLEVDLDTLPQGIYVVKITLQNGDVYSGIIRR